MVTIYSTPFCNRCRAVKLDAKKRGIPYNEVDLTVDTEKADELRSKNLRMLPVIEKNGEFHMGQDGAIEFMAS